MQKAQLQRIPSQQGFLGPQKQISLSRLVYAQLQAHAYLNRFIDAGASLCAEAAAPL